jgi:predicted RNase H-like HicB family nuclease
MKPQQLILKCYAKQEQGLWIAVCLDLTLATQGETYQEAKQKLEEQIAFYLEEALQDEEYGSQLLSRRAPISSWLEYYFIALNNLLFHKASVVFDEVLPLRLA